MLLLLVYCTGSTLLQSSDDIKRLEVWPCIHLNTGESKGTLRMVVVNFGRQLTNILER